MFNLLISFPIYTIRTNYFTSVVYVAPLLQFVIVFQVFSYTKPDFIYSVINAPFDILQNFSFFTPRTWTELPFKCSWTRILLADTFCKFLKIFYLYEKNFPFQICHRSLVQQNLSHVCISQNSTIILRSNIPSPLTFSCCQFISKLIQGYVLNTTDTTMGNLMLSTSTFLPIYLSAALHPQSKPRYQ